MQATTGKTRSGRRMPGVQPALRAEQWLSDLDGETAARLRESWRRAQDAAGDFGADFYGNLFRAASHIMERFPGDMRAQQRQLTETLGDAVALTANPARLVLLLRATGVRHHHYGAKPDHFAAMENALAATLAQRLGAAFSLELESEWRAFFANMSTVMRHAMAAAAHT